MPRAHTPRCGQQSEPLLILSEPPWPNKLNHRKTWLNRKLTQVSI